MSKSQIISAFFVACSLALLAIKTELSVSISVFCTTVLLIGITLIEKQQNSEVDKLSEQIKDLRGKVDMLLLNKGFGR